MTTHEAADLAALAVFNVGMTVWDRLRQRGDYWPSGAHRARRG